MKYKFKTPQKTKQPGNLEKAYDYAVFLLSLRLRTVGEMREKMEKRGYNPEAIEKVIEKLHSQKYLDDKSYAEVFLDNLKQYKNFGFYGIKKKFMLKKLPPSLIEAVLQEGFSLEEEIKIAERFLKKERFKVREQAMASRIGGGEIVYQTFADSEENQEKQKAAQRLKSRGFRSEVIARLVFS